MANLYRRLTGWPLDPRRQPGFLAIAIFCLAVLYAPIILLVLYSFNSGDSIIIWSGFGLEWYGRVFSNTHAQAAALLSIKIAVSATLIATVAATMAAMAILRSGRLRSEGAVYAIINQPLMVPEIILAIAMLSTFSLLKKAGLDLGSGYLILSHTVFCIPFAFLPIRARLEQMDPIIEQAAGDLYAPPLKAFWRITLPLLWPGILSGMALSFIVSFDDVIISLMVAGPGETTLPIYIWGAIRRGLTPELNAISSLFLGVSILCVVTFFLLARRQKSVSPARPVATSNSNP